MWFIFKKCRWDFSPRFSFIFLNILLPILASYSEVGPRVTSSQMLNNQLVTLNGVGSMKTSFWILAMTSTRWRHLFGFLQWHQLCGDISFDSCTDLDSVETSFWIIAMTSALWRCVFWLEFLRDYFTYWILRFIRDLLLPKGHIAL